jgi:hypothetical protein
MSNFTFIHTADWQIGKPFGEFAGDKPSVLRQARLEAVDRIADVARKRGAAHVLAAGDIFDFATGSTPLVRQLVQRLAAHRDMSWHLISGNHDPARPAGVWDDVRTAAPPPNVVLHLEARPAEIARGVVLLPAPLKAKSSVSDPTAWMNDASTPDGSIRIGLAHGSVTGFGSEGDAAVPIDPARPRLAGLAFLALGDWHGTKKIADRVWYSGTPEPDSFQDNEPGHVLAVTIFGAETAPQVERVCTAKHTWARRELRVSCASDLDPLLADLATLGPAAPHHLLQLILGGRVQLPDRLAINTRLASLEASLFHLATDLSALGVAHEIADLSQFGSGAVRAVAERLSAQATGADETRARVAAAALIKLADIAAVTAPDNESSAA